MLYTILKHAHSGFRWIVLLLLLGAAVNALLKWRNRSAMGQSDRKLSLFAMVFTHVQFLIGLVLYFISERVVFSPESMKVAVNRFFLVEHPSLMILAVIMVTIGYSRAKRSTSDEMAFRRTFWFYLIGLLLILAGIPWPMQGYGTGWF